MEENKNIRIKDIAKLAGVSVGTVDRVIHKRGKVSESARKKVEEVLKQIDYQPNLIARTLGSNKKLKILALIPDPKQDEYWALSNSGVDQAVEDWSQYRIEIVTLHFDLYDSSAFRKIASEALKLKPDAMLVAPIFHRESLDLFGNLKKAEIPYVLFNSNIPEASPSCFIGQNLYQSGRVAGELLNLGENGKKTIAVLHVYEELENSVHLKEKEDGLRDYFSERKDGEYEIISLDVSNPSEPTFEQQMLELLKRNNLYGILVTTSKGAHITASILDKSSLRHIRMVGYDLLENNISYLKKGVIDFLINQNPKRQAQLGISYLANRLLFKKEPPEKDLFPLEIITQQNLDSYISSRIH